METELVEFEISEICECSCGCKGSASYTVIDHAQEIFASLCVKCMVTYCQKVLDIAGEPRKGSPQPLLRNEG